MVEHWCRVVMNRETNKLISAIDTSSMRALEISGKYWQGKSTFKSYESLFYPESDICADCRHDQYEIIFCEQVFEHIESPPKAARNIYDMLTPGGYFLITVPFLLKYHAVPLDCWRWTESGLRFLLRDAGFEKETIITGSWGNKECLVSNLDQWTIFDPKIHSLENDQRFPLVVWALARKKGNLIN